MSAKRGPVFVQRRTYRRRRIADAARLLPLLGAILFIVPLLWNGGAGDTARTAHVLLYLFVVWVVLVGLAAILSRHLEPDKDQDTTPEDS